MRREDNERIEMLAILTLVVVIVTITLGFLTYTRVLIIEPKPSVSPNENTFKLGFSSSNDNIKFDEIQPTLHSISSNVKLPTATPAILDGTTIKGINSNFTEPGQSVVYSFYVNNFGIYPAYLKQIEFNNIVGLPVNKICIPEEGTTKELVDNACKNIKLGVLYKPISSNYIYNSINNISDAKLDINNSEEIKVIISYTDYDENLDGPFTVDFGDIIFNYSVTE